MSSPHPVTGRAGLQHPSLSWVAALLPGGRAGLQGTPTGFAGSVNMGGLGGIQQESAEMGKEIADCKVCGGTCATSHLSADVDLPGCSGLSLHSFI